MSDVSAMTKPHDPSATTVGDVSNAIKPTAAGTVTIETVTLGDDGLSLLVGFTGGPPDLQPGQPCWEGYDASVVESATTITVTVTRLIAPVDSDVGCALAGFERQVEVPLQRAWAGREVVDATSGAAIAVLELGLPTVDPLPSGWTALKPQSRGATFTNGAGSVSMWMTPGQDAGLRGGTVIDQFDVQGYRAVLLADFYVPHPHMVALGGGAWTLTLRADSEVDDATLQQFAAGLSPLPPGGGAAPVVLPPFSGSPGQVRGQEGPATVTGWLFLSDATDGILCDDISATGMCSGGRLEVDFGLAPPPDGAVVGQAPDAPVSITGGLKVDILFPGV